MSRRVVFLTLVLCVSTVACASLLRYEHREHSVVQSQKLHGPRSFRHGDTSMKNMFARGSSPTSSLAAVHRTWPKWLNKPRSPWYNRVVSQLFMRFLDPNSLRVHTKNLEANTTLSDPNVAQTAFLHTLGMVNLVLFVGALMWFPAMWLTIYVMNDNGRHANFQRAQTFTAGVFYASLFAAGLLPFCDDGLELALFISSIPIFCLVFFFHLNAYLFPPSRTTFLLNNRRRPRRRHTFAAGAA
ncbi:hypothetical protein AeMF1_005339 [Aphanomyces euteiches]|nr:hypothetical protein AeMF1_005339 [Aphanomyces euteiches]KAH9184955.1 hypothetical protein AeNC1_013066 [Aphanomyces euteiches]